MTKPTSDKAALDYFIELAKVQRDVYQSATQTLTDCIAGLEALREMDDTKKVEEVPVKPKHKTKAKAKEEAAPVKAVTLEGVRATMIELARSGKREAAKEIISSYGANVLSEVNPAHFAEVLAKAKEELNV